MLNTPTLELHMAQWDQSQIKEALQAGLINWQEARRLITEKKRVIWKTKEWQALRESLLTDTCAQCGRHHPQKTGMVLQHVWHPRPFNEIHEVLRKKYYNQILAANRCNHLINKDHPIVKLYEKIGIEAILLTIEEHERYISCQDTITMCKKCAYLMDVKGLKLCQSCRKSYIYLTNDQCQGCKKNDTLSEI